MQKFQIWPDVYWQYCFLVMQICFQCRFHLQSVSLFKVSLVVMPIYVFKIIFPLKVFFLFNLIMVFKEYLRGTCISRSDSVSH